jgi:hypothetical protein
MRESASQISPSLPTPTTIGENIMHDAWCPHPRVIYTNNDRGAWGLPANQHGSTHW